MAKTPKKVSDLYLREQNKDYLKPEYVAAPFTQVQNRELMVDLSQDLSVLFGTSRTAIQQIYKSESESGPNGEAVYKVVNDRFNQVRFWGSWKNFNDTNGVRIENAAAADSSCVEISFYGTGLNILVLTDSAGRDLRASIDGGAEGANIIPSTSSITNGRSYPANTVVSVASGLSEGLHTVKLRVNASNVTFYGYEVVNNRADLLIKKGSYFNDGKLLRLISDQNIPYNSSFENQYGTAGAKGGCVSVYLTEDGQIKKDIQWTDVSAKHLTLTDHSNEEVITRHNHYEFGNGRSDDFSTTTSSTADRAFVLGDGTTILVGDNIEQNPPNTGIKTTPSQFIMITFVGTGIDITRNWRASGISWQHSFELDGVSIGNLSGTSTANFDTVSTVKIASGLPYGTHTLKITRDTDHFNIHDFVIYGPKKPTIDSSAVEVASYYLMADFAANTTSTKESIGQGVVRKYASREIVYVNGTGGTTDWNIQAVNPNYIGAFGDINTNRLNAYFETQAFCEGFEYRWAGDVNRSNNVEVYVDGLLLTTANFPSLVTSVTGTGVSFNPSTGVLNTLTGSLIYGCSFSASGIPLGNHKIRLQNKQSGNFLILAALDVVTPIHSPKLNGPYTFQNNIRVGSTNVGDSRKLADGVNNLFQSNLYSSVSTSSTTPIPVGELNAAFDSKTGLIEVEVVAHMRCSVANFRADVQFRIDGVIVPSTQGAASVSAVGGAINNYYCKARIPVTKGVHSIMVTFNPTSGGSNVDFVGPSTLNIRDI